MSNGNGIPVADALAALLGDETTRIEMRARVDQYVSLSNEIMRDRFDERTREAMVDYLIGRGVEVPTEAQVIARDFDEHFATAYDNAVVVDGFDPVDAARQAPTAPSDRWQFEVDLFDELSRQGVIRENIMAAGAADYVYELGERMGIFRVVDALVLNWSTGAIDAADGTSARRLYRYLRMRDERSTAEERGMLYRRVLAKGTGEVLERMVENTPFPRLWHSLMNEVAAYIDKSERVREGSGPLSPVSRSGIYQATRELQYNLTEYCTGMAHMQVRELYAQLQECVEILRDSEIIAHFGGNRRKSMWTVIEYVSRAEFGEVPNIGACRQLAVNGNQVYRWIADFNDAPSQAQFEEFLRAAESYILTAAVVGEEPDQGDLEEDESDEQSDDDFGDDF